MTFPLRASPQKRWKNVPYAFDLEWGMGFRSTVNLGSHLKILLKENCLVIYNSVCGGERNQKTNPKQRGKQFK